MSAHRPADTGPDEITDAPEGEQPLPAVGLETALEAAGLLQDEYPDDMARRSCTCDDQAICGAHRLLARYNQLFTAFQESNSKKRSLRAERDTLAATLTRARKLAAKAEHAPSLHEAAIAHGQLLDLLSGDP